MSFQKKRRIFPDHWKSNNPHKVQFGCISIFKNEQQVLFVWKFRSHEEKSNILRIANGMVINRLDKFNFYRIRIHYGAKLNEFPTNRRKNNVMW